jgi:hypothetical protein
VEGAFGMSWKDFLIEHQWSPPRLLKEIDPEFNDYDLTNWLKKSSVKMILNRDDWKLSANNSDAEKARRVLTAVWRYRVVHEFKIDLEKDDAVQKLISQTMSRTSPLSSFQDSRYLGQLGGVFDKWISKGYTRFSFVCFHLYPGMSWCQSHGILPYMFYQTRTSELSDDEILAMMEIIWLRHIRNLSDKSSQEDIDVQKKVFIARQGDNDLFSRKMWQMYGVSSLIANRENGIRKWEQKLARKFSFDVGLFLQEETDSKNWNASRFRKENPDIQTTRCLYTNTIPADLHHLLSRRDYPELTYHPENVVPISPALHALITRKKWSETTERDYRLAQQDWLNADDGQRINCFDKVMSTIAQEVMPT